MDDYLVHQTVEPVRHVGTSDRNFCERHYFNAHTCDDELFLLVGLGQYPNLATQDAFVMLHVGDEQLVLRSSRALGDRGDVSCGPIRIDVIEGLKALRVQIAPNDSGIEADLTFHGSHYPQAEPRNFDRAHGRTILDVLRYSQTGVYDGWIQAPDGTRWSSDSRRLEGYRDRSWGIRPVGEHEPAGIAGRQNPVGAVGKALNWCWLHVPARFPDFTLNFKLHEDNNGDRYLHEAVRVWHEWDRAPENLGRMDVEFDLSSDKRYVEHARFTCPGAPEGPLTVDVFPTMHSYLEMGTGYGRSPELEWRHGEYRGDLVTDVVAVDLRKPNEVFGCVDAVARFETGGQVGFGLFEYCFFGDYDACGIAGPGYWNRVAP